MSIWLDNCRNPRTAGATTPVALEGELLEDEAEDDTHGVGGGVLCSEKVFNQSTTLSLPLY